jgi:hypothetical protein
MWLVKVVRKVMSSVTTCCLARVATARIAWRSALVSVIVPEQHNQLISETSSKTNDVCRDESSVPVKLSVTVCPPVRPLRL